ncbi:hypothetical protein lerEdw1_019998 [Lerista edwardsae]|nr:hypothetical protein lerEdw1_019998 [Lerista edwardsae]
MPLETIPAPSGHRQRMANEDTYEDVDWSPTAVCQRKEDAGLFYHPEKAPKTPALPPRPKKSAPLSPLLAVLVLLLGISLVTVVILCVWLLGAQPVQNRDEALLAIQETILASQAAAEERNRDLLELLSNGWALYNESWYFFSEEERPWWEAEEACVSLGAHLASVTSRKEMAYISTKTKGQPFWIGLSDQEEEGNWTWVDGTQYSQDASFWESGQPDNWQGAEGHQEDCVHARNVHLNSWNDQSCTIHSRWICKKIF